MMEPTTPTSPELVAQPKRLTRKVIQGQITSKQQEDDEHDEKGNIERNDNGKSVSASQELTNGNDGLIQQEQRARAISLSKVEDQGYALGSSQNKFNLNQKFKANNDGNDETPALGDVTATAYVILEPLRSDPIKEYQIRQRRLERIPAEGIEFEI